MHILAKPTGAICNLDCGYCFYLSKEALYPGDRFRMSEDTLEAYLSQLLDAHPDGEVTIAWQGGEPTLMGVEFFRHSVELAEAHRRAGQRLQHTIQTNATLLTDEWCELFAQHGFLVGVSIDGPPELHDRYRVDKRGEPTSAKVLRGLELLMSHGVEVNVLCTVNAANQHHPLDVYRYFRDDLGVRYLQLIPIVERNHRAASQPEASHPDSSRPSETRPSEMVTERSVDPDAWGGFLRVIFDEWVVRDVGEVFVQMFDAALAAWLDLPSPLCIFRQTCGDAVALEHNGDIYSCDHFVEPAHLLGNIATTTMVELVTSPKQRAFGQAKLDGLPEFCRRCEVRFACNGECPKDRFILTPDGEPGLNYLCSGYRHFFNHIDGPMRIMADLVRGGGFADEIIAVFRSAGRNEPCPCGSGTKTKLCHGT